MTDHPSALVSVPVEGQSFSSEQDWINRASRVLTAHPEYNNAEHGEGKGWRGHHFTALCFDQAGNRMRNGGDFMRATKEQTYPVWWIWPDQIAAMLAAAPAAPQAAGVGVREAIVEAVKVAMNDAWCDITSDTNCWPADLKRATQRGPMRLEYRPAIWTDTTAEMAANAILALRAPSREPEGGAVDDGAFKIATDLHKAYEQLIYGLPKYLDAENLTDEENMIREAWVTLDVTAHRLAALATREEAPAEAGEDDGEPSDWAIKAWTLASEAYGAHMGEPDGRDCFSAASTAAALAIEQCATNALRAQPQAREDAQPVGWLRAADEEMVCAHLGVAEAEDSYETAKKKLASLIQWNIAVAMDPSVGGSPASDALRVAVEALEPFALLAPDEGVDGANMDDPLSKWFTVADLVAARQARLAALQAEQGAK